MSKTEIAALIGARINKYCDDSSDLVSVVGDNYVRIRVDSETRVRFMTDVSVETMAKLIAVLKDREEL